MFKQIWAAAPCLDERLTAAPPADLLMIARKQDVRDAQTAEFKGARVLGKIEQSPPGVRLTAAIPAR